MVRIVPYPQGWHLGNHAQCRLSISSNSHGRGVVCPTMFTPPRGPWGNIHSLFPPFGPVTSFVSAFATRPMRFGEVRFFGAINWVLVSALKLEQCTLVRFSSYVWWRKQKRITRVLYAPRWVKHWFFKPYVWSISCFSLCFMNNN